MVATNGYAIAMHYEQANLYAHVLGHKNILFHYFNKNNSESLFLTAPYSPELASSTIAKFNQVKVNQVRGVISDRPYTDPTASPCWFCKYKDECYSGYRAEVLNMKIVELDTQTDALLLADIDGVWRLRATRLETEKEEDKLRTIVSSMLLKRGINSAKIGSFSIDIKLGSKNNPIATIKKIKE
jgi:hypothetical protein